jgi:myo-inositol 2-dehydrogenase / D-chiro-inositol 1-dehydrogenase
VPNDSKPRRDFLGQTAAAAGLLLVRPQTAFSYQANSTVELGLVGCGSRGNWITPLFQEFTGARVAAVADVVKANLETTRAKFKVDTARAYYGPHAFAELAASKVDAVVIETPPYYHPEHAMAAVDAGKHVYLAKPVAVDVPGCNTIEAAGRKALGKTSFFVDFQTRAQPVFQEAAARAHRGDIGRIVSVEAVYFAGRPWNGLPDPVDHEKTRLMTFYMDKVLGGDIIVEQNIHTLDVVNWFVGGHPVKAFGTGGRTDWKGTKWDVGDAFDHFLVTFWYPNDTQVQFTSNQLTNSYNDIAVRCFGIKGSVDAHYNGLVRITGENAWKGTDKDDTFRQGAINNAKAFVESIRTGKLLNNTGDAVTSTLTAILGRTAAYQGRTVTWDEMLQRNEKLSASLKLRW